MNKTVTTNWMPIEKAPKYPVDEYCYGPKFIALDPEWGAIEARWSFPQPGSIAYAENHPPKVNASNPIRDEVIYLKPTHFIPMPEKPL